MHVNLGCALQRTAVSFWYFHKYFLEFTIPSLSFLWSENAKKLSNGVKRRTQRGERNKDRPPPWRHLCRGPNRTSKLLGPPTAGAILHSHENGRHALRRIRRRRRRGTEECSRPNWISFEIELTNCIFTRAFKAVLFYNSGTDILQTFLKCQYFNLNM